VRDAEAAVGLLQPLAARLAQASVLADALVDEAGQQLALALQQVVPLFEKLHLLLERQQRVLRRRNLQDLGHEHVSGVTARGFGGGRRRLGRRLTRRTDYSAEPWRTMVGVNA